MLDLLWEIGSEWIGTRTKRSAYESSNESKSACAAISSKILRTLCAGAKSAFDVESGMVRVRDRKRHSDGSAP